MNVVLENAVMAIQVGVEDLHAKTPARTLSSIRNLHAGVMLLLKAKLRDLSPEQTKEVLLKSRVLPSIDEDGKVVFIGKGNKTVNVEEAIERLKSLGVHADWTRIRKLTQHRNDIEHYAPNISIDALHAIAASVQVVVREFSIALNRDPLEMFGEETWNTLLENKEVFHAEYKVCLDLISKVDWRTSALEKSMQEYTCADCGSPLVTPVDSTVEFRELQLKCRSCGDVVQAEQVIPRALDVAFKLETYEAIKDGGYAPIALCPHCDEEAFVVDEGRCALCEEELSYTTCLRCGEDLSVEEQDFDGSCGYCDYMRSKMMEED